MKLAMIDEMFILNDECFRLSPLMFEYEKAVKLLCINEGFEWSVENFFKVNIYSIETWIKKNLKIPQFLNTYLYRQLFLLNLTQSFLKG